MSERVCCACRREMAVSVVSFPLLREGYPVGPACHASWRSEAQSLGASLFNPARVYVAFTRWLDTRRAVA